MFGLVFPPFWISSSLTCFSQHEILSRHRCVALILDTWTDPRESIVQSSQWTTQILQCCPSSCRSLCPSVTQLVLISLQCHIERHDDSAANRQLKKASLCRITWPYRETCSSSSFSKTSCILLYTLPTCFSALFELPLIILTGRLDKLVLQLMRCQCGNVAWAREREGSWTTCCPLKSLSTFITQGQGKGRQTIRHLAPTN